MKGLHGGRLSRLRADQLVIVASVIQPFGGIRNEFPLCIGAWAAYALVVSIRSMVEASSQRAWVFHLSRLGRRLGFQI